MIRHSTLSTKARLIELQEMHASVFKSSRFVVLNNTLGFDSVS